MRRISQKAGFIMLLALLHACRSDIAPSTAKTDLGAQGNADAASRFAAYQAKSYRHDSQSLLHCPAPGPHKRALISGFGLFSGISFNISGTVVTALGDQILLPSARPGRPVDLATTELTESPIAVVSTKDEGGFIRSRQISIGGEIYDLCLLTLDVQWDLAAAIIVDEATRFQPDLLFMTGRNGDQTAVWEGGAINYAVASSGYHPDGSHDRANTPVGAGPERPVLASVGTGGEILVMTWDNQALKAATEDLIKAIDSSVTVRAPTSWRQTNNYICNNVSLVALAASAGLPISLADGLLNITPLPPAHTQVGFFHFPANASGHRESVQLWLKVFSHALKTALGSEQSI